MYKVFYFIIHILVTNYDVISREKALRGLLLRLNLAVPPEVVRDLLGFSDHVRHVRL
jgi:hypothetical protein